MLPALPAPARDVVLLVARVLVGSILVAHGLQKLMTWGLGGTAIAFEGMGVPLAPAAAAFAAFIELVGGGLIILGALTFWAAVLVALDMLGAALLVHVANGVFIDNGGWELTGALFAVAIVFAAVGAGRFSVDHVLTGRRDPVQV